MYILVEMEARVICWSKVKKEEEEMGFTNRDRNRRLENTGRKENCINFQIVGHNKSYVKESKSAATFFGTLVSSCDCDRCVSMSGVVWIGDQSSSK